MDVGNTNGDPARRGDDAVPRGGEPGAPVGDALFLGADERGIFVRAVGSIRATLCFPLRDALLAHMEKGAAVPPVSVDLSACHYMDSTFIGLLVAMDKRLRKAGGARLRVLAPSTECREIFAQIGLQDYLTIEDAVVPLPVPMEQLEGAGERPGAEFVLRAHEALMETSEEARRKFALLKDMLEKKLRSEKTPKDTP